MSTNFSDDELALVVERFISPARHATFRALTNSDQDAVRLHQHSMQVSAALMSLIGTLEIALRNSCCRRLRDLMGTEDWLQEGREPALFRSIELDSLKRGRRSARKAVYAKMSLEERRHLDAAAFPGTGLPRRIRHLELAARRQSQIPVTNGQIVAQLTLHFWKRLFSDQYEPTLWKTTLKRTFPNKTLSRAAVAEQLENLYAARNRIAHHEPIYGQRLRDALAAIDFVSRNLETRFPSDDAPLRKLIAPNLPALSAELTIFREAWKELATAGPGEAF